MSLTVKEFWKSVNIWRSYGQDTSMMSCFLTHSVVTPPPTEECMSVYVARISIFTRFFCAYLCPWLTSLEAALRYVIYFRFCGWRWQIMAWNRRRNSDTIGSSVGLSPWRILKLAHQGQHRTGGGVWCPSLSGFLCVVPVAYWLPQHLRSLSSAKLISVHNEFRYRRRSVRTCCRVSTPRFFRRQFSRVELDRDASICSHYRTSASAGICITCAWHARTPVHLNMSRALGGSSSSRGFPRPLKMPAIDDTCREGYTTCECRVRDEALM